MNNIDKFKIPYNSVSVDNHLLKLIMLNKTDQIIDGCIKFVSGGKLISLLINTGMSSDCHYSEAYYNHLVKPYKPISCIDKLREKFQYISTNSVLLRKN